MSIALRNVLFVSTDNTGSGDIKRVDDDGIGDQQDGEVIFMRHIPRTTTATAALKSSFKTSPRSSSRGLGDNEENNKGQQFDQMQLARSSPSSDSSDQSLPYVEINSRRRPGKSKHTPGHNLIMLIDLLPVSSADKCRDVDTMTTSRLPTVGPKQRTSHNTTNDRVYTPGEAYVHTQPVTTSWQTDNNLFVTPTWSQVTVKMESAYDEDNVLRLQNTADGTYAAASLTQCESPSEPTLSRVIVKQEPTCVDTSQHTDELSNQNKRHVGQGRQVITNKRRKCRTVRASASCDEVKKERYHDASSIAAESNCSVVSTWSAVAVKQECISTFSGMSCEEKTEKKHNTCGDSRPPGRVFIRVKNERHASTVRCHADADESRNPRTNDVSKPDVREETEDTISSYQTACVGDGVCYTMRPHEYAVDCITNLSDVTSKKQQVYPSTSQPLPSTPSWDLLNGHDVCNGCVTLTVTTDLSVCPRDHLCCGQCLLQQAKSLLANLSKVGASLAVNVSLFV